MTISLAFHEAAHAVADVRFGFNCAGVTIIPNKEKDTLGCALALDDDHFSPDGEINIDVGRKRIIALLAGYAAEVLLPSLSNMPERKRLARLGASSDFEKAREVLRTLGLKPNVTSWLKRARNFARSEWCAIEAVARELLDAKKLDETEIETLIAIADGEEGAL